MCGIAGFVEKSWSEPEARTHLGRMLDLIAHRGPDGEGTHIAADGLAFGMRRLSIIDLEGGAQPVWNEDRTVAVVFNGEIYNFVELQATLESRGHRFRTRCDTEVLVHLYEEAGENFLQQLRGMFALAIYDVPRRRLLLARDHFGQKPLYYTCAAGRWAFASELKCLLALPWVDPALHPEAFLDYAAWLSLPPPATHFRAIKKLGAGSALTIDLRGGETSGARPYWCYDLTAPPDLTVLESAVEVLDHTVRESVRLHLRSDVPMGVLLSSGLDSRAVASYAQELHPGQLQTFTVGFGGPDSETAGAARTAQELGVGHHSVELTARDFHQSLERVAWHLDEPIGDPAAFAVLKVCELARGHVKVLLSGEGADELFAGYDQRYLGMEATLRRSDLLRPWRRLVPRPSPGESSTRWQRLLSRAHQTRGAEALALRREGFPGDVRHPRGLGAEQRRKLDARGSELAPGLCPNERDLLSELLVLDLRWQLPESLLQKADKMSMAASIELRTPLLDREVAAVAARLPSNLKLPAGGPGKLVLRHCVGRRLNEPLDRPKRGFPLPLAEWFRGPLREPLEAALFCENSACGSVLDRGLLRTAWEDFLAGRWDGARVFYALWIYEVWRQSLPR